MSATEIIVLVVIAVIAFSVIKALMQGAGVILALVVVAILLGGYSITQFKDDAGKVLGKTKQIACPQDAAVQLRAAKIRMARVQLALNGHAIGPQRRDDLSVESATLRTKIARLQACVEAAATS